MRGVIPKLDYSHPSEFVALAWFIFAPLISSLIQSMLAQVGMPLNNYKAFLWVSVYSAGKR